MSTSASPVPNPDESRMSSLSSVPSRRLTSTGAALDRKTDLCPAIVDRVLDLQIEVSRSVGIGTPHLMTSVTFCPGGTGRGATREVAGGECCCKEFTFRSIRNDIGVTIGCYNWWWFGAQSLCSALPDREVAASLAPGCGVPAVGDAPSFSRRRWINRLRMGPTARGSVASSACSMTRIPKECSGGRRIAPRGVGQSQEDHPHGVHATE